MITGMVSSDEARIRVTLVGRQKRKHEIVGVVDTGYSGALTLQSSTIAYLNLRWRTAGRAELADGSICDFQVYEATVLWDGKVRTILVDQADTDPLIGMKLLRGHELKMQVRARGKVTIKRLR